ncbi:MAG: hypothetical protein RLZZ522_2010, partial [Verrucomicrobiota bacterium]
MKPLAIAFAFALGAILVAPAQQAVAPDAAAILRGARMAATLTTLDAGLSGKLKKDGKTVPVTLFLKGKDIQF